MRLDQAVNARLDRTGNALDLSFARLAGLDPEAPLARGYAGALGK